MDTRSRFRQAVADCGAAIGRCAVACLVLAGCASYSGSTLVAGKSDAAAVEALMGPPDEKLALAGGESVWFYPRPDGGDTYAVRLRSDGIVQSVEQRLTEENIAMLRAGVWTRTSVRELFGPPYSTTYFERLQREVWTYKYRIVAERMALSVQFSDDGVVREVLNSLDYDYIPASGSDASMDAAKD
jgi:hypothetical protein